MAGIPYNLKVAIPAQIWRHKLKYQSQNMIYYLHAPPWRVDELEAWSYKLLHMLPHPQFLLTELGIAEIRSMPSRTLHARFIYLMKLNLLWLRYYVS